MSQQNSFNHAFKMSRLPVFLQNITLCSNWNAPKATTLYWYFLTKETTILIVGSKHLATYPTPTGSISGGGLQFRCSKCSLNNILLLAQNVTYSPISLRKHQFRILKKPQSVQIFSCFDKASNSYL
jgi:hypothetical protein